jgi:hypothetical protein
MKKDVVGERQQIVRRLMGLPTRGRPRGRRTGTNPGKRSIPQAWRDLDMECLEHALKELTDESPYEQFVNCAARRAHVHERAGDYKIRKLDRRPTSPRRPRTHEQRVRQRAKDIVMEADRELLGLNT